MTGLIEDGGYAGIALLMFVENLFPPIPSELVMPLAGFMAARGDFNVVLVVLAGEAGSLAGAAFWYWVGRRVGTARLKRWAQRHGRWLTLTPDEVDAADRWFDRHGGRAVLVCRIVPGLRTLISIPAGVAEMRWRPFLLYTALGTLGWTTLLAAAGFLLEGHYERVAHWAGPAGKAVLAALVLWYLWRVATFRRRVPKPGA